MPVSIMIIGCPSTFYSKETTYSINLDLALMGYTVYNRFIISALLATTVLIA